MRKNQKIFFTPQKYKKNSNFTRKKNKNIHVFIKIRPLLLDEKVLSAAEGIRILDSSNLFLRDPPQNIQKELLELKPHQIFTFTKIFNEKMPLNESNDAIIKESNSIGELISGKNQVFLFYGPKSTGKTYTLLGNNREIGLFASYSQKLFDSLHTQGKINVFMKVFEFGLYGFRDLLTGLLSNGTISNENTEKFKRLTNLKPDFKGTIIGISKKNVWNYKEAMKLLKLALKSNESRDSLYERASEAIEKKDSHFFIEIELNREENEFEINQKKTFSKVLFVDLVVDEPLSQSIQNFEKILSEMAKNHKTIDVKLIEFFKTFDCFAKFMHRVIREEGASINFIGCLSGSITKNQENLKVLNFLNQCQKIHVRKIHQIEEIEYFFVEKKIQKFISNFLKELSELKYEKKSIILTYIKEMLAEFGNYFRIEAEFFSISNNFIDKQLEGYTDFKEIYPDFLFLKESKFKKKIISAQTIDFTKAKIVILLKSLNKISDNIKQIKNEIILLLTKEKNKNILHEFSSLLQLIEIYFFFWTVDSEFIFEKFKQIDVEMEKKSFPLIKTNKIISNNEINDKNNGVVFLSNSKKRGSSLDKLKNYLEPNENFPNVNILERAKSRLDKEKKVIWLRNHKIILEKLEKKEVKQKDFVFL